MGMLLRWQVKSILANDITFPTVYNLLGLHKTTQYFYESLLRFGKNNSSDFMLKKVDGLQQKKL